MESPGASGVPEREEFLVGAKAMGLVDKQKSLKPQQLRTVDVLNEGKRFTAVLEPRRSTKTTTLIAWAIGRCLERDDYLVAYTVCTTGKKARDRYLKDIVPVLERQFPDEDTRPFKIRKAAGQERIEFKNGSLFQINAPGGDDFRSDAYDVIIFDEAGEASPDMGDDLLSAALPTQDTRPNPMVIMAGTAARYRTGNMLWDALVEGRQQEPDTAIIEYSAEDYLTAEDVANWELVAPVLELCHPGVGNLTSIEGVKGNYMKMKRDLFMREYLGIFGDLGSSVGLVKPNVWNPLAVEGDLPELPDHFAFGIAVDFNQNYACIVAAWRVDGVAYGVVLDHREGQPKWLADRVAELAAKYGGRLPIAHESMGTVLVSLQGMLTVRPKLNLVSQTTKQVTTAAALLIREIETHNVRHYNQKALNEAILRIRRRKIGNSAWGFGRADMEDDITPAEALSMALRTYDDAPVQVAKLGVISAK